MVAPSYQNYIKVSEIFELNNKKYIKLKNPKTNNIRACRWYTKSEYDKLYPEVKVEDKTKSPYWKPQKEVLGFTKGYITIFKGDTHPYIDWFRVSIARYARWWGWYIISTKELPSDIPDNLEPVKLSWDLVGNEDGSLKSETEVKEAVESLIYDSTGSEYVGKVGDRLELTLTVEKNISLEGAYGHTYMHLMRDENGNLFLWNTASKNWPAGSIHHIRGTVKMHSKYKNEKQTVLIRCLEVK